MKYNEAVKLLSDKYPELIEELANTDDLELWGGKVKDIQQTDKKIIFEIAEAKWIKRKINDNSLLLHPDARKELIERNYKPLSKHRKMIWASILVTYEGGDSKQHYQNIKNKIIKKHSSLWWRDVHNKIKPTFAAKERLKNQGFGAAFEFASQRSTFLGGVAQSSRDDILRMIPND